MFLSSFANMFFGPGTLVLLTLLAVAAYSVVGLVAIWGGLGRPHWFLRSAVVGGVLLIWLAIPAYELVLIFFVQSVVTVVPLAIIKSWQSRRTTHTDDIASPQAPTPSSRLQFSLADLLLVTLTAAVVFAVAASAPSEVWIDWWEPAIDGAGFGILTLFAAGIALAPRRLWLQLIVTFLVFPCLPMVVWLVLRRASSRQTGSKTTRPRIRRGAQVAVVLLSLLLVLPLAAVYYKLLTPTPIPQTTLPDPNGYDDLVRAGKALDVAVPEDRKATRALRSFVEDYGHVLETARIALDKPSQVPIRYVDPDLSLERMQALRELARAFVAEGRLAEAEGRTQDAMRSYFDTVRLGVAINRGGMELDLLVGWAITQMGLEGLDGVRQSLTAEQCRELLDGLQALEADKEPLKECFKRERAWIDHALGWEGRLVNQLEIILYESSEAMVERVAKRHQATMRLVTCGVALRRYRLEQGHLPATLAELVPDYLATVPQDPFSGRPLVYRRRSTDFLLYSWAYNEQDDGGQPFDWSDSSGDFVLDGALFGPTSEDEEE